jgi:hypothetical protein
MAGKGDDKKEMMGKVYREFSRQKYNKYKHQFPKMRESEIVSKIIKEWDALNGVAKDHLQKIYEKNKCLTLEDISSSEQLMKSELLKKEAQMSAQRSSAEEVIYKSSRSPVPPTKVFPPATTTAKKAASDSEYNRDSKSKDDSKVVDSSSPKILVGKSKKIGKVATGQEYTQFYKLRYAKLHAQHPRWTSTQISSIIRLEWKKEKKNFRVVRKGKLGTRKPAKVLSGYKFYRRYRGFSAKESVKRWLHFPYETKVYWTRASSGKGQEAKREKYSLKGAQDNTFGFLVKKLTP